MAIAHFTKSGHGHFWTPDSIEGGRAFPGTGIALSQLNTTLPMYISCLNWAQNSRSVTPASKHVLYSADEYKGLAISADHGLLLTENTSWVKLRGHSWTFRTISGHFGPFQTISGHFGPFWAILSQAESSWVKLSQAEPSWVKLSQAESNWVRLSQAN